MKNILVKCDRCGQEFLMRDLRPLTKRAPKGVCLDCKRKDVEVYRKWHDLGEKGVKEVIFEHDDPDEKHDSMRLIVNDPNDPRLETKTFYAETETGEGAYEKLKAEIIRQANEAGIPRNAYFFYNDIFKEVWGKYPPTEE